MQHTGPGIAAKGVNALDAVTRQLGQRPLKAFEVDQVAGQLARVKESLDPETSIPEWRVALLSNSTVTPLANAVRAGAVRWRVFADVHEGTFDAVAQDILDPGSALYAAPRDAVILAFNHRFISRWPDAGETESVVDAIIASEVSRHEALWNGLRKRLQCPVLQHTIEPLGRDYVGVAEAAHPWSPDAFIARLNAALKQAAPEFVYWVDTARLATQAGLREWHDWRIGYAGRFAFSPRFLDDYGRLVAGMLAALYGATRKCLVLDLDNTLWGGVVGDDGVEGIELGPGSPGGEAYEGFCRYLLALKARGIALAVCSRNDERIARSVFETHPAMPLRVDDFAEFVCSWDDKAAGLARIASRLNLAPAHLAFVDDNPAECDRVGEALRDIGVLRLEGDPSTFIDQLERTRWFTSVRYSAEDNLRAASYASREKASELLAQAGTLEEFLAGLEMRAEFFLATPSDLPRLAQMEAKTNQFNVTTKRLTENDLCGLLERADRAVYACKLRDRFADHGLVSSVIVSRNGDEWVIDGWVMSCRVFSRTLEQFICNRLAEAALLAGATSIVGCYAPTERNGVVRDLYKQLGFDEVMGADRRRWRVTLAQWLPRLSFVQG